MLYFQEFIIVVRRYSMVFYKRWGFWFFIIVILLSGFFILNRTFRTVEIKTAKAKRQGLTITVTATSTGTIKADEEVKLTAQRIGRISKLLVKEGSIVKTETLIAELDPDEVVYNLQMSEASLQKAQHRLDELMAAFNPLCAEGL